MNIGVIGAGQWGKNHVRVYHGMPEANLSILADKNKEVLDKLGKTYGLRTTTDYKEVINDPEIDAVDICVPNDVHYEIVKAALEAGKHVLVEKPLTLESETTQELGEFAKSQKKTLMVGHIFRFNPAVCQLKEELDRGTFGQIHFLSSSRIGLYPPKTDSGVIIDLGIHDVDIFNYLLGKMPISVSATGGSYLRKKFEETAFITLDFENDVLAHADISWLIPTKVRSVWLAGEKKSAYVNYATQEMEIFNKGIEREYDNFGNFTLITREGDSYKPYVETAEPLKAEILHFLECLKSGKESIASAQVGYDVIKIIEAAQKSLKEKRTVFLEDE